MHELPVTQALLKIALDQAQAAQAARITGIYIEVGELSSYVDDSVQFYWDIISQGTIAEGARLHFERIPLEMQCRQCQARYHPDGESFRCPKCGSNDVAVTAGDALNLVALDVENEKSPVEEIEQ